MPYSSLADLLGGEGGQKLGHAKDVANLVLRDTSRFGELFDVVMHEDAQVAVRACDVMEQLSRARPDLLVALRHRLIADAGASDRPEIQRNVARMLARVRLEPRERSRAIKLLEGYVVSAHDRVALEGMQTLTDYSMNDPVLRRRVVVSIEKRAATLPPVMQARSKRMVEKLRALDPAPPPPRTRTAPPPRGRRP